MRAKIIKKKYKGMIQKGHSSPNWSNCLPWKICFDSLAVIQFLQNHYIDRLVQGILTLFRMGKEQKGPPYQFFSCANFYKHNNYPLKFSDFQFQPFCHTDVNFQGNSQCQSQIVKLEPSSPVKKVVFSGQILIKLSLL